jgi:head-tail adaptor
MSVRAGHLDKYVTFWKAATTTPDSDGNFEPLSPSGGWAAIQPLPPGGTDGRSIAHAVTIRYHPQITLDARLLYGTRELFVRGVQNVGEQNAELHLSCEEVVP